jgi:hypothetical protein
MIDSLPLDIALTGRAGVDHVEPLKRIRHGIGLDELERVTGLRLYIHPHDFVEARP